MLAEIFLIAALYQITANQINLLRCRKSCCNNMPLMAWLCRCNLHMAGPGVSQLSKKQSSISKLKFLKEICCAFGQIQKLDKIISSTPSYRLISKSKICKSKWYVCDRQLALCNTCCNIVLFLIKFSPAHLLLLKSSFQIYCHKNRRFKTDLVKFLFPGSAKQKKYFSLAQHVYRIE